MLTSQNDTLVLLLVILVKTSKKVNISHTIMHSYCPRLWLQTLLSNGQYTNCLLEVMGKSHDFQLPVIRRQEVAPFGKILGNFSPIVPPSAAGVRSRLFRREGHLVAGVGTF